MKLPILTEENQYLEANAIQPAKAIKPKVDDLVGINIEASFKIYDPTTNEVHVQGRG